MRIRVELFFQKFESNVGYVCGQRAYPLKQQLVRIGSGLKVIKEKKQDIVSLFNLW